MSDSQSLTAAETKSIIDTGNAMADAAREVLLPRFRSNSLVTENKSLHSFDPVTDADKDAEKVMISELKKRRPTDGVFGEEFGELSGERTSSGESGASSGSKDSEYGAIFAEANLADTPVSLGIELVPMEGVIDTKDVTMFIPRVSGINNPNISIDDILSRDGTGLVPPKNVLIQINDFDLDAAFDNVSNFGNTAQDLSLEYLDLPSSGAVPTQAKEIQQWIADGGEGNDERRGGGKASEVGRKGYVSRWEPGRRALACAVHSPSVG